MGAKSASSILPSPDTSAIQSFSWLTSPRTHTQTRNQRSPPPGKDPRHMSGFFLAKTAAADLKSCKWIAGLGRKLLEQRPLSNWRRGEGRCVLHLRRVIERLLQRKRSGCIAQPKRQAPPAVRDRGTKGERRADLRAWTDIEWRRKESKAKDNTRECVGSYKTPAEAFSVVWYNRVVIAP